MAKMQDPGLTDEDVHLAAGGSQCTTGQTLRKTIRWFLKRRNTL